MLDTFFCDKSPSLVESYPGPLLLGSYRKQCCFGIHLLQNPWFEVRDNVIIASCIEVSDRNTLLFFLSRFFKLSGLGNCIIPLGVHNDVFHFYPIPPSSILYPPPILPSFHLSNLP